MLCFGDQEIVKGKIPQTTKSGFATHLFAQLHSIAWWKRAGTEPHLTNHCLRSTSVTLLSDHDCETRHIKYTTGLYADQAVDSFIERSSMEEQQKMPLVLSHFIGNTSSVHGKGNEIQQQCRPIPDEFPHHAPGRAVLLENNFSKSATSVSPLFLQLQRKSPQLLHFSMSLNFEHLRTLQ